MATRRSGAVAPRSSKQRAGGSSRNSTIFRSTSQRAAPARKIPVQASLHSRTMSNGQSRARKRS